MQYTPHYNLNLPEGSDIVNPLIQDNPNYTAIDTALYANKLRVIGNATETKTGTVHTITRLDTDIPAFKFIASGDYDTGDSFTVDGVSVTVRIADGRTPKNKAYVINSTVYCILDGTILNIINITSEITANDIKYDTNTTVKQELDSIEARLSGLKVVEVTGTTDSSGYFLLGTNVKIFTCIPKDYNSSCRIEAMFVNDYDIYYAITSKPSTTLTLRCIQYTL